LSSVIKVDKIQSDTGTVNVASNISFTGAQSFNIDNLSFKTNGTERLFFDSTGRGYANTSSLGITYKSSSTGSVRVYGGTGTNQWDVYTNGANIRFSDNTGGGKVRLDTAIDLAAGQIQFPATQNASADANTLDDYEEGSFTTVLDGTTAVSYANQVGRYTKIGRIVQVQFLLQTNSQTFASSGATLTISGLPFSGSFPGYQGGEGAVWFNSITFSGMVSAVTTGTTIQFRQSNSGGSSSMLANSAVTGGMIIHGTIVYMV
jgi:hypothetical protein